MGIHVCVCVCVCHRWGTSDDSSQGLDPHVSFQMRRYLPTVLPDLFATSDKPANDKATHSTAPGSAARPMLVAAATAARADGVCGDVGVCGGRVAACGKPEVLRYELEWSGILGFTKVRAYVCVCARTLVCVCVCVCVRLGVFATI